MATSPFSLQDDLKGKFIRGKGMKRILFNSTYWAGELPDRKCCGNRAQSGHGKLVWLRTGQSGQETSSSCTSQLNWPRPRSLSFLSLSASRRYNNLYTTGEKGTIFFFNPRKTPPSFRSQRQKRATGSAGKSAADVGHQPESPGCGGRQRWAGGRLSLFSGWGVGHRKQ